MPAFRERSLPFIRTRASFQATQNLPFILYLRKTPAIKYDFCFFCGFFKGFWKIWVAKSETMKPHSFGTAAREPSGRSRAMSFLLVFLHGLGFRVSSRLLAYIGIFCRASSFPTSDTGAEDLTPSHTKVHQRLLALAIQENGRVHGLDSSANCRGAGFRDP